MLVSRGPCACARNFSQSSCATDPSIEPVKGFADDGKGCTELLRLVRRLRPRLVVSGHIHAAHARVRGTGILRDTTFVNAANAHRSHTDMGWGPVVVDL